MRRLPCGFKTRWFRSALDVVAFRMLNTCFPIPLRQTPYDLNSKRPCFALRQNSLNCSSVTIGSKSSRSTRSTVRRRFSACSCRISQSSSDRTRMEGRFVKLLHFKFRWALHSVDSILWSQSRYLTEIQSQKLEQSNKKRNFSLWRLFLTLKTFF